jgi:hypothetical protein
MLALPDSLVRRRSIVFGAASLGALHALPAFAASGAKTDSRANADPRAHARFAELTRDPREALRMYIKLNGDDSGKPFYSWFAGHVYAVNQGQITTPLFGIEGYGMGWTAPQPDGGYRQVWKEIGFYKDLKTDAILTSWHNPLNDATCEVMHINNRSVNFTMLPRGNAFTLPPGLQVTAGGDMRHVGETGPQDFSLPWFVNGDCVATTMDTCASGPHPLKPSEWPRESSGERYSTTEFLMHYGSLRELLDEKKTSADSVSHWTRIVPWFPWMLMGQAPGQCVYRAATQKLGSFEEIPQHLRDYAKAHYPAFLALSTPEEQKLPPESSYEVFRATRKPQPR